MKKQLIIVGVLALSSITTNSQEYVTIDGFGYQIEEGIVTVVSVPEEIQSLDLPEDIVLEDGTTLDVTRVGMEVCANRTTLKEVNLPNTIKIIGIGAFCDCTGLERVSLSASLIEICNEAFKDCSSLEDITLPSSLIYIDYAAFMGCCSLKEVYLPSTLSEVGNKSFVNCDQLSSIISQNPVPPEVTEGLFPDSYNLSRGSWEELLESFRIVSDDSDCVLYVPEGSIEAYANAPGWKWFKTIKEISTQGIESAVVETESKPIYYDLQGVKIANPRPGSVVIRRQGSKSEKIIF